MSGYNEVENYLHLACQPLEVALGQNDDVAQLIISLGASIDFGLKRSLEANTTTKRTVKDWVEIGLKELMHRTLEQRSELSSSPTIHTVSQPVDSSGSWQSYLKGYADCLNVSSTDAAGTDTELEAKKHRLVDLKDVMEYLLEIHTVFSKNKAKTWQELYPSTKTEPIVQSETPKLASSPNSEREWVYTYLSKQWSGNPERIPQHLIAAYDELYDACYNGDNEKIQNLCLPDCGATEANDVEGGETPLNILVRLVTKPTEYYYPDWGHSCIFLLMRSAERCSL